MSASTTASFELCVRDFGAAGDGTKDDTRAVQDALGAAADKDGGVVIMPSGRYRFDGTITIPSSVTLKGVFGAVPAHTGVRDPGQPLPEHGTVLMPHAGKGSEEGDPFITIEGNGTLQGVVVYYPEQATRGVPIAHPWTIAMNYNNAAILDVELLNPYNGIDCTEAHRFLIRNVHGQPLRRGVYVDQIYDIGRIENVHWNPWFSMEEELLRWQMENGEAFIFGRTDWQSVINTFCYGYNIGYRFIKTEAGACNGSFVGIGADDCYVAIQIDECFPYGLLITNGEFVSFKGPDPTMVVVSDTHTGSARFVNCAYWGPNNQIAKIAGSGTVGFSDCTMQAWDRNKEGCHAIQASGGTVLVRGCEFRSDAPQVELGSGVRRAVIAENVFTGAERITNHGAKSVQIGLNAAD